MTRFSRSAAEVLNQASLGAELDFEIQDAMAASVEDAIRSSPTQGIVRGIQNYFDTSAKIDPLQANQEYGLAGTDAEFKEGEEVTVERAKAVSDDYYRLRTNQIITDTVNDESPIMGRVTQFAASMAAGFTDPIILASNVGGGALVGAGIKAVAGSARGMGAISRVSPQLGRMMTQAYSDDVVRRASTVLAREGLENFASSIMEETVNFMGIGEERLARNVTAQESLMNVTAGTLLGTIGNVVLSKDSRKAIGRSLGRRYGDDAAEAVQADLSIASIEAQLGIERSHIDAKELAISTYGNRPWYDVQYNYADPYEGAPGYISVGADGSVYSPSYRGSGTVLTDSRPHAYNKGVAVREFGTDQLLILRRQDMVENGVHTELGTRVKANVIDSLMANSDYEKLSRSLRDFYVETGRIQETPDDVIVDTFAMAKQMDDYLSAMMAQDLDISDTIDDRSFLPSFGEPELVDVPGSTRAAPRGRLLSEDEMRAALDKALDGKDLDQMIDQLDEIAHLSGAGVDVDRLVDGVLDANGMDGYMFVGKDGMDRPAYNGTYVKESSSKKLMSRAEYDVPQARAEQLAEFRNSQAQRLSDYADSLQFRARALETKDADLPVPRNPEVKDTPLNPVREGMMSDPEVQSAVRDLIDNYERKVDEAGEGVEAKFSPEEEADYRLMKKILETEDTDAITSDEFDKVNKFIKCIRGE